MIANRSKAENHRSRDFYHLSHISIIHREGGRWYHGDELYPHHTTYSRSEEDSALLTSGLFSFNYNILFPSVKCLIQSILFMYLVLEWPH